MVSVRQLITLGQIASVHLATRHFIFCMPKLPVLGYLST